MYPMDTIIEALATNPVTGTTRAACRRWVETGGVRVNGVRVTDAGMLVHAGDVVLVGKNVEFTVPAKP